MIETRKGRAFAGMSSIKKPNKSRAPRKIIAWSAGVEEYVFAEFEASKKLISGDI